MSQLCQKFIEKASEAPKEIRNLEVLNVKPIVHMVECNEHFLIYAHLPSLTQTANINFGRKNLNVLVSLRDHKDMSTKRSNHFILTENQFPKKI